MNRQFIKTALVIGIVSTSLAFCGSSDKKNSPDPKDTKPVEDSKPTDSSAAEPKDVKPVDDAKDAKDSTVAKRDLANPGAELFAQLNESLKSAR